jgi:hypothetical protein
VIAQPGARARLPFRVINRAGQPGHDPDLQRHHLLPCQLRTRRCFGRLLAALDPARLGFDDFRRNGLLLPAGGEAARRLGLPLHRGPHRDYHELVIERVGQIEACWSARRPRHPDAAGEEALFRLALLQRTLRRRLLEPRGAPVRLNAQDPLGTGVDFTELDAMAEQLWAGTQTVLADSSAFAA